MTVIFKKQKQFADARRVFLNGVLLLLPFLALQLTELFVLPIDFFTFRVWEAALATPYRYPGAYYPNLHVKKVREYGDYYRGGDLKKVQAKPVEWFTDSYGWRNRPEVERREKYDIVMIGDSNVVGSFLDQKDTISEALSARSGKVVYSYSMAHDLISLFFSDPQLLKKSPDLLVVESKVINWNSNDSYLTNFWQAPNGQLDAVDRSEEFKSNFYSPDRKPYFEKLKSRLAKQAMFHSLKSNLSTEFSLPTRSDGETFFGTSSHGFAPKGTGWRPENWIVEGGNFKFLSATPDPALAIRAKGPNCYWHTERFISTRTDGKIVVRFQAKNSAVPTRHRVWIFEDGSYRSVGELVVRNDWRTFEIPLTTNPGSVLEFQIDQWDDLQWLSIKDFEVMDATLPPLIKRLPVRISMAAWPEDGLPCNDSEDCRQWLVAGKEGHIQTPVLPEPGESGILVSFEARADRPAIVFSSIYLLEGKNYRVVAHRAFGSEWRKHTLVIRPDHMVPARIQIDYPGSIGSLSIRNFEAVAIDRLDFTKEKNVTASMSTPETTSALGVNAAGLSAEPFPRPVGLTPLDGSGKTLTLAESQYYFYHATKALRRKALERGMDFILFMMPDYNISRLLPAIKQLRLEGIKVLAYEPQVDWTSGVDVDWYWQKADSHWTEAAVRLTADEILRMRKTQGVSNRPFSRELMESYSKGYPNV